MKPLPVRVKVKAAPPTETLAGEIFESEGSGLLIVSVKAVEVPPPGAGLTTVIEMVPEEATSLAGIAAVSCVLLTNAVLLLELFTRTTELATKLPPLSVSVNPALPALILAGEILESEGDGLLIVRARAAEVPPPGAGFATVIESVPEEATSLAGIAAVSCVLLTKVVVRFAPLARTTEPGMKPLPVSVRVKAALPAETLTGEIVESEGDGLLIVSVKAVEAPPPGAGFAAVIETVPEEATSLAGIAAVSCVLLTKVVLRLEPFTCTRDPFTKFEPFTVSVKVPLPTTTVAGDRLVSDGTGLLTVKVRDALVPPPGVETVTERDPAVASVLAGIVAVNCVLLTNIVLRFTPLTCTTDVPVKFVPVAVRATGPVPATAEAGEIVVSVGVRGVPGVMVRFNVFEVQPPPSEFTTFNASCPATLRSLALS